MVLMLHIMAFLYLVRWLPYNWIIVVQKITYVIKVLQHVITLIPAYIPTHFNVEADWTYQGDYISSSCLSSPSSLQVYGRICKGKFIILILITPLCIEVPWLPKVLNRLEDIPPWHPIIKDLIMDVLVGQVLMGLPFLPLSSQTCFA